MDSTLSIEKLNLVIKKVDAPAVKNILEEMNMIATECLLNKDDQNQIVFAATINGKYAGILAIELSSLTNAHISLLETQQSTDSSFIVTKLLQTAENYCYQYGYTSLTLQARRPELDGTKDVKTDSLYEKLGYKPLFKIKNHEITLLTVYMQKIISLADFEFIDLTHTLTPDVPHWGVDVGFKYNARYVGQTASDEVKFRVQRLEMSAGIGTHMDAPSHCFEEAASIDDIPIGSLITTCKVVDVSDKVHDNYRVLVEDILTYEANYGLIPKGAFVIIYTGWDARWIKPEAYRNEKIFPSISIEAAQLLVERDIIGLGIDTLSPDAFGSDFPVHQLMLGAGKYIIENVANAKQLGPTDSFIFALPIKVSGGTEAPIRLIGMKRKNKLLM